jgi:cytochrome c biogenesis protein CcmG, thiol:disulfide interchange protein DsbE
VIAISIEESLGLVEKTVSDRNYRFQVAIDSNGQIAKLYHVEATPTIVLIDAHHNIQWMSTGLSPSLSFRIEQLFKN